MSLPRLHKPASRAATAAFRAAHFQMVLREGLAFDDPNFDDGYFYDCLAVLGMIEHGASQAEITAYDAASTGVFDEWWLWFRLTLAQMPRHLGGGGAE